MKEVFGNITLYNDDCMEIMRAMPDNAFDLAIVDPPYRDMIDNSPTKDMRNNGTMKNFGNKPTKEYFEELYRVSKNQIIWGANNFQLPPFSRIYNLAKNECSSGKLHNECGGDSVYFDVARNNIKSI